jgi:hypothetical protein
MLSGLRDAEEGARILTGAGWPRISLAGKSYGRSEVVTYPGILSARSADGPV